MKKSPAFTGNLDPLAAEHWPQELQAIRSFLAKPLNIHKTLARHPALMKAWMPIRNHVVHGNTLSDKHREMLILRTAHNSQAAYEWRNHVVSALHTGLGEEDIERIRLGPDAPGWQADESALLQAVDDCYADHGMSADTRCRMEQHFSVHQQLDILVTTGLYTTLAFIVKSYDVPMDTQ